MILIKWLTVTVGILAGMFVALAAVLLVYILVTDWLQHRRIEKEINKRAKEEESCQYNSNRFTVLQGGKNETKNGNS